MTGLRDLELAVIDAAVRAVNDFHDTDDGMVEAKWDEFIPLRDAVDAYLAHAAGSGRRSVVPVTVRRHDCELCDLTFDRLYDLEGHVELDHGAEGADERTDRQGDLVNRPRPRAQRRENP